MSGPLEDRAQETSGDDDLISGLVACSQGKLICDLVVCMNEENHGLKICFLIKRIGRRDKLM
jgi:hypothetical protein